MHGHLSFNRPRRYFHTLRFVFLCASAATAACSSNDSSGSEKLRFTREQLLDPETCKECHVTHYDEWAGSMHAYAADDPVFLAMNARGQRETNGALGSFCVGCHAPLAVREGATKDGLNLASVPRELKGITCYFCHNIDKVDADHNNQLTLANDLTMRGAIRDPIANGAHHSAYSTLTDRSDLDSSAACGACHDLRLTTPQFAHDVHLERTFEEWKATIFDAAGANGQRCGSCHMRESIEKGPIADVPGLNLKVRPRHLHDFPGVDLALTPFPEAAPANDHQRTRVQSFLDTSLVTEVCVAQDQGVIRVLLDNATAGHNFPSGAAQDRRAWVEVKAYVGEQEVFSTVTVPDGQSVLAAAAAQPANPLWLMRDQVLKANGEEAHMFWDVASVMPREQAKDPTISGTLAADRFNSAHLVRRFPEAFGSALGVIPDRVVVNIFIRPMDYDVVDDLIASGDLKPEFRGTLPTLQLLPNRGTASPQAGANLEWTRARAQSEGFQTTNEERLRMDCLNLGRRSP